MSPARFIAVVIFAAVELQSLWIEDVFIEPHLHFCFAHAAPSLLAALCVSSNSVQTLSCIEMTHESFFSLPFPNRS